MKMCPYYYFNEACQTFGSHTMSFFITVYMIKEHTYGANMVRALWPNGKALDYESRDSRVCSTLVIRGDSG